VKYGESFHRAGEKGKTRRKRRGAISIVCIATGGNPFSVCSSVNAISSWKSPVAIFSMKDRDKFNGVLCCFYPIGVKWGTGSKVQRFRIKAGTTKIGILKSFSCNA